MKFGVQLNTLKKYMQTPESMENTFAFLCSLGIEVIELPVSYNIEINALVRLLEKYKLSVGCIETTFDELLFNLPSLIETAKKLNCNLLEFSNMPNKYCKYEYAGMNEFIYHCNNIVKKLDEENIKLTFHHGWQEFKKYESKKLLDIIADEIFDLKLTFDTFWFDFYKISINNYIEKYNDKIEKICFCDSKRLAGVLPIYTDIGCGKIDFQMVLKILEKQNVKFVMVDNKKSLDPKESIRKSWNFLTKSKEKEIS